MMRLVLVAEWILGRRIDHSIQCIFAAAVAVACDLLFLLLPSTVVVVDMRLQPGLTLVVVVVLLV